MIECQKFPVYSKIILGIICSFGGCVQKEEGIINMTLHLVRSVSTIGGGGDTTIPSPGRSPKQLLPGIGLHDPLHDRQACPEFNSFHQGVGQLSLREGLFSCPPLPKRGQICDIPAPPSNH